MSKNMMMVVTAGAFGLLAIHPGLARGGGGAHGGLHAMPIVRPSTGAASTPSGNGGQTVRPNINEVTIGNTTGAVSSSITPPRSAGGVSPSLAFSPSGIGAGLPGTVNSPPLGTNSSGAALGSGLPTGSSEHLTTGQPGNQAKSRRPDDSAIDSENTKVDRVVKSICKGC
jgi:hypothetical protein